MFHSELPSFTEFFDPSTADKWKTRAGQGRFAGHSDGGGEGSLVCALLFVVGLWLLGFPCLVFSFCFGHLATLASRYRPMARRRCTNLDCHLFGGLVFTEIDWLLIRFSI